MLKYSLKLNMQMSANIMQTKKCVICSSWTISALKTWVDGEGRWITKSILISARLVSFDAKTQIHQTALLNEGSLAKKSLKL